MGQILFFDFCALPIYILIIFTIFVRKTTMGSSNVLYIFLTAFLTLNTIIDIMSECYGAFLPFSESELLFFDAMSFAYLILRNLSSVIYVLFIITYTRTMYRFNSKKIRVLFFVPEIIVLIALLTNPIHRKIYTVSAETGYSRGPYILLLYIVALIYAAFGSGYLIYCRRFIETKIWVALLSMYVLSLSAVFWQYLYPDWLVEMYASAVACLMITLLVLRPEEITDTSVGLPGWQAYKAELHKIVTVRHPVQIIVMRYINGSNIRTYIGEEAYRDYVRKIADILTSFFRSKDDYFELFYEGPGTLYCVLEGESEEYDIVPDIDRLRQLVSESTGEYEAAGVHMEGRICSILYPGDADSEEEIIRLGHEFKNLIPPSQIYVKATEFVGTTDYEIGTRMDVILNKAITEKKFEMYYQPIYSLKDERFKSAEALIRLWDDTYGPIPPGIFIPAAERMGLMLPIGDFVLESVFRFIADNDIRAMGLEYIEINLSVAQCLQYDLANKIKELQDRYGISPEQVNFEITETSYDDIGITGENNIKRLVEMGYSFSLDDYGTGYSNIRRLSKLPLKIIKIDKSLIDDLGSESGKIIIKNVIRMMKDIDKELVAEGVESDKEVGMLSELDCDFIQGFYYSKPLPVKEFVNWIRKIQAENSKSDPLTHMV
ncbi:MAG: EAL domain-containing protein [Lachnospiraceae bacterium]|nr:EAL domain-containing protein [Lachnospiraceae bacterium]